jgi:predicted O-methyltransferase YrrM
MEKAKPYTKEDRVELIMRARPDGFVIVDGARLEATIETERRDAADRALGDVQRWIARIRGDRI